MEAEVTLETCLKKRQFPSIEKAREVGKRLDLRAYHCPHCYKWHLTSDWEGTSPDAFAPIPPKKPKVLTAKQWANSRERWLRKNAQR